MNKENQIEDYKSIAKFSDENPNPVLRISKEGRIIFANKGSAKLLNFWNCKKNDVLPEYWKIFVIEVFQKNKNEEIEIEFSGNTCLVLFSPVADEGYISVFGRDITEHKKAENEIELLARFPNENPNPVMRIDKDGTIVFANKGSEPLLETMKCDKGEFVADYWFKYITQIFKKGKATRRVVNCNEKVFLTNFTPILEAGYIYVYGIDITKRQQAENSLRKALIEVEHLKNRLQSENIYLREEIKTDYNYDEIIFDSKIMMQLLKKVEKVAPTNATVLILGETGTGKELIARAIHNQSDRSRHPLVKVNCASLPASLIESELFGYEKGAFTGAMKRKPGRFELANEGTIFLDEIGDMPLESQAKLLRVLQEGEFEHLGGTQTIKVNVRIIAATNHDLEAEMEDGNFRKDLFYRLNVFPLTIPPLRERKEDILLLVTYLVGKIGKKIRKPLEKISKKVIEYLTDYHWPGNIRELENIMERALIITSDSSLDVENFPNFKRKSSFSDSVKLKDIEKEHIQNVLRECNWKINGNDGVAARLDIPPSTLRDKIKKLGIEKPSNL